MASGSRFFGCVTISIKLLVTDFLLDGDSEEETMRKLFTAWLILSIITMKILRAFATVIVNFNLLPIHVAVVESKWLAGSDLGRKPGNDVDQDIKSFIRRDSHIP